MKFAMTFELETFLRDGTGSYVVADIDAVREQLPKATREGIVKRLDCRICGAPAGRPCPCTRRGVR